MTDWQPIDTAPKDGTWFVGLPKAEFTFAGEPYPPAVMRVRGEATDWTMSGVVDFDVECKAMNCGSGTWMLSAFTHWMPLPDRPSEP